MSQEGTVDDDANTVTPCVVCSNTLSAFIPAQSVGHCNDTMFTCPGGTFNGDNDVSTPCVIAAMESSSTKGHPVFTSQTGAAFGVLMGVLVMLIFMALFVGWRRHKRISLLLQPYKFGECPLPVLTDEGTPSTIGSHAIGCTVRAIPRELQRSSVNLLGCIGEGVFGTVHKGLFDEGNKSAAPEYTVAVKVR